MRYHPVRISPARGRSIGSSKILSRVYQAGAALELRIMLRKTLQA